MLLVALAVGVGAAWVANKWVRQRLNVEAGGSPVVVATREIPFGTRVGESDVRLVSMPEAARPRDAFPAVAGVTGRVATQTIYPGEVLIDGRVVEHLGGSALAAVVSRDKRAVTVRVNDVVGVAGFLLPGNRVDVIATRRGDGRQVKSFTLLENKKVLAVDQTASPDKDQPVIVRAVTLELNPEEAESLVKATEEGKVQMALRNPLDNSRRPEPKVEPSKPKVTSPVRSAYVTVIRGMDVERQRVRQ